ncbi:uncharacterized protein A4U43_C05F7110 [Asparagus officinalis]|uniref:Uncharacterized protein n=1 Tax=Asparagus officinalis TaxID=4686 RepID=A0A5P1EU92_ASPOF|nr:uncharacterized protein A4U43_C05F7110 [Asparagus officinalis]
MGEDEAIPYRVFMGQPSIQSGARPKAPLPAYSSSRHKGISPQISSDSNKGNGAVLASPGRGILERGPQCCLHQSLQSYLVRGVLAEQEIFDRIKHIWTSYLKLLGEVIALRASKGTDSEWETGYRLQEILRLRNLGKSLARGMRRLGGWRRRCRKGIAPWYMPKPRSK